VTELLLFTLREGGNGGLFLVHSNTWWEAVEEMEPDTAWRCRVVGLE